MCTPDHCATRGSNHPVEGRLLYTIGAALLLSAVLHSPVEALDFTLHTSTVQEDGFTHEHSYFRGDDRTIVTIDPPAGWIVTSDARSITAIPRDILDTQVKIEKSTLPPSLPFKDRGLETYRHYVAATLPQGATNFQSKEENPSPLPVFNWKDFEFVVTYDLFGQAFKRATIFINVSDSEQIVVTVVAPAARYDAVHKQGLEIMRSWSPTPVK